ncbi:putative reverse transcriptase domain-containing protein [Tanacetum coccineum]
MEVDIDEDENEPELTYPYEEVNPHNPSPPTFNSEPEDVIEVEDTVESEDETIPASVHEVGNEVHSSVEQGTTAMEKLVEKLGNVKEKAECKKLKKELEEARPNEAIDVPIAFKERLRTDSIDSASDSVGKKSPSIMPPKSAPLTQATIRRMIKESVDAERARHANVRNDARGSGPVRGQDAAPVVRPTLTWWNAKVATIGLETVNQMPWAEMKQLMTAEFCPIEELQRMEHELWNLKVKEYNIAAYTQRFNELALMCPRMVEPESMKVDAYIWGLTDNIKGEVTSFKPANLNEAVRMAHKLMEQKSQARDERILEGKKRKWESFQSGNNSGKSNHKDNSRQTLQNNQKKGKERVMITAPTNGNVSSGSLPLCERCFTRHVGPCTIKCYKCEKVKHKARYCNEKNVAMGENA